MKILGILATIGLCASTLSAQHVASAKPMRPAAQVRATLAHARPMERRSTAYWQSYCFSNPWAVDCQDRDFAVRQNAATPASPSVILNPSATAQTPGPAAVLVNPSVSSAPAPAMLKVCDQLAAGVTVGASQEDILQKLGQPHSRISGGIDRYTYFLESGGALKLEFEGGHVTQVWKAGN